MGYFQTYRIEQSAKALLISALDNYSQSHPKMPQQQLDLVIHSRLGDYKNEASFGIIGQEYFSRSLDFIDQETDVNKIGLFSDEPMLAKQQMPSRYRDLIEVMESIDDTPLLVLSKMRSARNYVLSNSTFGWWAAFTSTPEKVIVPRPWFSDAETPNGLLPEEWIQVVRS